MQDAILNCLTAYASNQQTLAETKRKLLSQFGSPQSERQAVLLDQYIEDILQEIKSESLNIELATTGLTESATASWL